MDLIALDKVVNSLPDGPEFTTALAIPETAGQASAVIATYNRCPFDPHIRPVSDNPLTWALDSLLAQAGDVLAEIIVVDDGSTDHTPAVLAHYTRHRRPGEVRVAGIRLERHAGTAVARNTGITAVRSRWVLFGDDDCVFSPHYAAGAAYLMHALSERDPTTAAAMLPFYYRALRPRDILPTTRIGVLIPETAEVECMAQLLLRPPAPVRRSHRPRHDAVPLSRSEGVGCAPEVRRSWTFSA